jgi:hypothetical protein
MLEAAMGAVIEDVEAARSLLFPGPGDVYAAAQRVKRAGFTELRSAFLHFGGPQTAQFLQLDIVVDAVGVCEQDKTDSHTLNRKPSVSALSKEVDALKTRLGQKSNKGEVEFKL